MSKEVVVIILGIVTALTPFLGLPGEFRTILLIILGLGITAVGFFLRSETLSRGGIERSSFFIDNRNSPEPDYEVSEVENPAVRIQ